MHRVGGGLAPRVRVDKGVGVSSLFLTWGNWAPCLFLGTEEEMTEFTFHLPSHQQFSGHPSKESRTQMGGGWAWLKEL